MAYAPSRERDEETLAMLRLKCAGWTWPQLAQRFSRPANSIQQALMNVKKADTAESGEDTSRSYW